jgi:hypothetical protein
MRGRYQNDQEISSNFTPDFIKNIDENDGVAVQLYLMLYLFLLLIIENQQSNGTTNSTHKKREVCEQL